jgi:hypothetical protein
VNPSILAKLVRVNLYMTLNNTDSIFTSIYNYILIIYKIIGCDSCVYMALMSILQLSVKFDR